MPIVKQPARATRNEASRGRTLPDPPASPGDGRCVPWHAGFLLFVGALGWFRMVNSDIWWHLRTGQLIVEQWRIPATDWYTYTNPDAPWVDLHWIFQVVASMIYSVGGSGGLVVAKCLVGVTAFLALVSIRKRNWNAAVGVLCWIIPAVIFSGRFLVRPEVVSILLLAATLFVLHAAEKRPRLLWLLPLIQVVWVNTQSLFILQWVVLAAYSVDAAIGSRLASKRAMPVSCRRWTGIMIVTSIATLCNPYGVRGALFPATIFAKVRGPDREFYHAFAAELKGPLDLVGEYGLFRVLAQPTSLLLLLLFAAAFTVTVIRWKRGDLEIFRSLLLLGFAYLALKMTRNSALFAVIGGYTLRWNLGSLMESVERQGRPFLRRGIPLVATGILVAGMTYTLSGKYHSDMRVLPPRDFGLGESDWYPHEAAGHLLDAGMPGEVYAQHLGVAAVCIHHASPPRHVFVDARLETNTRHVLEKYKSISEGLGMGEESALRLLTDKQDAFKWPAIIIANSELVARPRMLGVLAGHKDWVCGYSRRPAGLDASVASRGYVGGASIFVAKKRQTKEGLSRADTRWLFVLMRKLHRGY